MTNADFSPEELAAAKIDLESESSTSIEALLGDFTDPQCRAAVTELLTALVRERASVLRERAARANISKIMRHLVGGSGHAPTPDDDTSKIDVGARLDHEAPPDDYSMLREGSSWVTYYKTLFLKRFDHRDDALAFCRAHNATISRYERIAREAIEALNDAGIHCGMGNVGSAIRTLAAKRTTSCNTVHIARGEHGEIRGVFSSRTEAEKWGHRAETWQVLHDDRSLSPAERAPTTETPEPDSRAISIARQHSGTDDWGIGVAEPYSRIEAEQACAFLDEEKLWIRSVHLEFHCRYAIAENPTTGERFVIGKFTHDEQWAALLRWLGRNEYRIVPSGDDDA